jgi:diguanylate cyclase (GGDEF)-like protein
VFASSLGVSVARGFDPVAPPLVFAFFQRQSYFLPEAARFAAYQALGVTTIVGFPGESALHDSGLVPVDLSGRPEIEDAWILGVFDGALGGLVVAVDDKGLVDGPTLESSRRFVVRWSVDPAESVAAARQLLAPIRARLDRRTLALTEGALRRSEEADVRDASEHLMSLLQALSPLAELPTYRGEDAVAERDLLTGLHNRRFLDHYLPRAAESASVVAALLVDIDDLAQLNERLGAAAGDAAVVAVANVLAAEHRAGDVLVRYGDDEFLMLAAVDGPDGAVAIAERIVMATRAARLEYPFDSESVTISVGVATADPAALPLEQLSDALRLAKMLGKNVARLAD